MIQLTRASLLSAGPFVLSPNPAEHYHTGKDATRQLVEAGAACVAARSLLSASARHLVGKTEEASKKTGGDSATNTGSGEYSPCSGGADDDARLLSGLVWRYLELGARGRVCVVALRRGAREMAGGGRDDAPERFRGSAAEEVEGAALRLEQGLRVGEGAF